MEERTEKREDVHEILRPIAAALCNVRFVTVIVLKFVHVCLCLSVHSHVYIYLSLFIFCFMFESTKLWHSRRQIAVLQLFSCSPDQSMYPCSLTCIKPNNPWDLKIWGSVYTVNVQVFFMSTACWRLWNCKLLNLFDHNTQNQQSKLSFSLRKQFQYLRITENTYAWYVTMKTDTNIYIYAVKHTTLFTFSYLIGSKIPKGNTAFRL